MSFIDWPSYQQTKADDGGDMLRITIEVVPFGQEDQAKVLDQITVANDLSHPERPLWGNYKVQSRNLPDGHVFNHRRDWGFWPLIHKVVCERESQGLIKKAEPPPW